jgi:cytochrome P450
MFLSGKSHLMLPKLHERYGPVVRLAPNELSFTVPEAWEDIFGRAQPGKRDENQKAHWYLSPGGSGILGAAHADHARMRRLMSNGFSTGAMIEQQPKIREHVDTLIERLRRKATTSDVPVDLREWYNYCTFDIIGELALGESFGCLRESAMHPWISLIFSNIRLTAILLVCKRLPLLFALMPFFISIKLVRQFMEHQKISNEKVERRLALPDAKPDFVANMLSVRGGQVSGIRRFAQEYQLTVGKSMSRRELNENAVILTLAGSETTASALCGATYLLMQHPRCIQKLRDELQCYFKSEGEMDLVAVTKLPYLCAVTDEALRIYPPGPNSQPRITPTGGNTVLGHRLPKGVSAARP